MNKQKVVVTGGAGFIGSNLVDRLVDDGYDVHVIDNISAGKRENINTQATLYEFDILNLKDIAPIIEGALYVFHLAAMPRVQYSIEFPEETFATNVTGTQNVLIAAKDGGVKKVIFSSSSSIYGDQEIMPLKEDMPAMPKSPYAMHKYMGEILCKQWSDIYELPTVCLRYFNVYGKRLDPVGPYALVIGIFMRLKKEGKPLSITGDGSQTRDFINVKDVVEANIKAATSDSVGNGEVINIGYGSSYSIKELAETFGGPIEYIAPRLEPKKSLADNTKARNLLGWIPKVSIEEGIKEIL